MTQPNSIFSPKSNPLEHRANWLGRYLSVERSFIDKLKKVLTEAASNIDENFGDLVNDNVSTKVARVRIALAHKEIRRQMREIFGTTKHLIKDHQQDAAVAAVNAALYDERGVLSWLFPDSINRVQYADSLKQTAKRNIESTITRVLFTEKPLSERVYKTEALANGIVSRTVNNALARGDSAKNLAKDVRALIDPEVPGGVSYAAMRLGRTEINNAFHAQSIMDSQEKPWVEEMRWHLSKRHEKDPGDECETYSLQGTFKKENVPEKPHPNCRCFVTPELPSYDQFENALISGQYDPYLNSVMGEDYSSSREMIRRYSPKVQAKIDKEGHKKGDLWPDDDFTYDERRELQEYNNAKRRNEELKKLEALEKNTAPIKDSKIPESISSAENPKQVVNWLKDNYSGLEMVGFDDARVDIRMAQEIAEGFVKVQEKYPDNNLIRLKISEIQDKQGNLDTVVAETRKVVSSKGNSSEIVFNQYFMDKYEELKSLKQGEAKTGFHTKGSGDRPWYSNFIHEFGHVLDYSGNYSTGRSLNPFKLGLKLDETPSATLSLIEYYENLLEIKNGVQTIVDISDEAQLQGYWDWVLNYAPSTYSIITKNNRRFVFGDEYVAEAFIAMETLEKTTGPTKAVFKILMESLETAKRNKSILVKIKKKKK